MYFEKGSMDLELLDRERERLDSFYVSLDAKLKAVCSITALPD